MSMLTAIASQVKPDVTRCLNDWYYKGDLENQRHAEIIEVMPQFADFHPSTVVLAYVESACGPLKGN